MTHLTEQQAWLTIAEAFATPRGERTDEEKQIAKTGVCAAFFGLGSSWYDRHNLIRGRISVATEQDMRNRIPRLNQIVNGEFWPIHYRNDLLRADFCYLQYYMCGGE